MIAGMSIPLLGDPSTGRGREAGCTRPRARHLAGPLEFLTAVAHQKTVSYLTSASKLSSMPADSSGASSRLNESIRRPSLAGQRLS